MIQHIRNILHFSVSLCSILGSFSNDDGDLKKAIGLLSNAFLYISLPSLHDYDVKMPNCKFYGGGKQAMTNIFFSV